MYIKPTKGAKSLWDIDEDLAMEALLANPGDSACPYDPDITIEGDKVIIVGSIGGSDSNQYNRAGYCRCECSVDNFTTYYSLEIPDQLLTDDNIDALLNGGWREA